MNYERHYTNLMLKAEKRQRDNPKWYGNGYVEKHHWFPKSLYPELKNEKWNIITLTAKEHFTCHHLLSRWLGGKMDQAFHIMCHSGNKRSIRITSRHFEYARRLASIQSKGENNAMFGKKHSEESLLKMVKSKKGLHDGANNPFYGKTHSQESKDKMSKSKSGELSWMHRLQPWKNPSSKAQHVQWQWSKLDHAYKWWLLNGHKTRGGGSRALLDYLGKGTDGTCINIIKYCRKFPDGTWYDSEDYNDWNEHFNILTK